MHIQEIIVDGFKSYAHRTVIQGFDPHFNAITGLNGSGKSNILDSICFVLGITNLSQVRAGNLSELVYKQGQAGVNKATVTIVFNNEDETNSPVGYEQCREVTVTRQVLIGGKSKYLINGRNAPAGQVQNLFHSVQLNVNNPHFLIMQGRITKVLNMKPHEILGMVEEAAGTRMYETKRIGALKTIDKKQAKLDELNAVLAEEITPTLDRLRGEKQSYLKWSKNNADMERIQRFVIASEFFKAQKALESEDTSEMETEVAELEATAEELQNGITTKEQEINDRTDKLKGEYGDSHKKAKALEDKRSKDLVKVTTSWQSSKEDVKKAEEDLESARKHLDETKKAVDDKTDLLNTETKRIDEMRQTAKDAEDHHAQLALDYQNMSAGISSSQGDEGRTLPEQISKAHNDSKTAEAKIEQAKLKIKHMSKELKSFEKQIKKEGTAAEKLTAKKDNAAAKVSELKAEIEKMQFSEDEFTDLDREKSDLESVVAELSDKVDALNTMLEARLRFKFQDPVRGFDRSKVKGLVAKLVKVQDEKNATALEVVAGARLYQVIVDENITAKALLKNGKLERRVTIIPLDVIKSRQLSPSTCEQAGSIADSLNATAMPAIELVGFDEEVRQAMEYVFGASIVVDGEKAAERICKETKTRTVTLDGDVYDPTGTITGGSKNNLGTTLSSLSELATASQQLEENRQRLKVVSDRVDALAASSRKFEKLSAKLELAEAELSSAEKHLSQTSFGMLIEQRDTMSKELEEAEKLCIEMEAEKVEKWELYETLKEQEAVLTQERENRLKDIESAVQQAKTEAVKLANDARQSESELETMSLELNSLAAEVLAAEEAVRAAEKALQEASDEESEIQMRVGGIRALYEEAKAELDRLEKEMSNCSAELVGLKNEVSDATKERDAAKVRAKKLSVAIARMHKERAGAEKLVASMSKKYCWIESEKQSFGVSGGDYDFEQTNPAEVAKQLKELEKEQEALTKTINKKVMGMIEKAEGEYTDLLRKRKVVENDKKKIQDVIEELDVKKKSELERTWVKVNRDFGSIFTTLLPGASAKLEPPEGMHAWEGLEVKVAFGDVWKESLSELSGGQRSLLALSLILSLLLFKPAPMYILDEVDAALDLSHTQNIGTMLKTHFSQSQFIVVSLKEGMFNNANVIFRTKFVEGVSTVTRTIGTGSSRGRTLGDSNAESAEENPRAGKGARSGRGRKGKENGLLA